VPRLEVWTEHLWMLVPGLLVVYLGFDAGGYFAGATGAAAAGIALLLAVRAVTARGFGSGLSRYGIMALVGLAAFAALSLVSMIWSHAPARALLSFDLSALYLALTALSGSVQRTPAQLRTLGYGLLAGLVAVCGAGLVSRTLPHLLAVSGQFQSQRLSYPVTYWNALGMLAVLGIVLAVHVTSDRGAPAIARVGAAGLVPVFATTLLLTFSRGSIATLGLALALYVLLAPRLSLVTTALAVAPFAALAVRAGYEANLLGTSRYTSAAGVHQGHHVAVIVGVCILATWALRAIMILIERRLPDPQLPARARFLPLGAGGLAAVVVAVAAHGTIIREFHRFADSSVVPAAPLARTRLTSTSDDGRVALWRVALDSFAARPARGSGAGTYAELWDRARRTQAPAQDAHSLYLQVLAELGVGGEVALVAFLLGLLLGAGRHLREPNTRPVAALAVATLVAWALHSAVDWDWQMPAVMAPVLALLAAVGAGGSRSAAATMASTARASVAWLGRALRPLALAGGLALGVVPALVAVSQADLDGGVTAFTAGHCRTAIARARAADDVIGVRPDPLEIIGYCQARLGQTPQAVTTIDHAISRDPGDWELRYALAIVSAADGRSPYGPLRAARQLDSEENLINSAYLTFRANPRRAWKRIATRLPLDVA
jgi:O-antigen ligase